MADKLSNSRIVKIGIVTHDVEETAARFRALFPESAAPDAHTQGHAPSSVAPYVEYRGERSSEVHLKVENIYTENFWFELIQPVGDAPSPWRDALDTNGISVCFTSIYVDSAFEHESAVLERNGYARVWFEEKGYERYAYFDTADDLGLLLEVKERKAM